MTKEAMKLVHIFHEAYERLAPRFGYETRPETRNFDPESKNGKLMLAVCREIIEQPAQQEPVWSDAGDLKRLKKGDVLRVLRKGQEYYSAFRFDGLLQECDYTYDGDAPFVWLEVDMATLDKIVYTRKDLTTGAIYADRGDRVELFQPTNKEALAQQPAPATQLREQEPVAVHQFRNRYVTDWYDGVPDHQDGHGPYEVRTLYTSPPAQRKPLTEEAIERVFKEHSGYGGDDFFSFARAIEAAHGIKENT